MTEHPDAFKVGQIRTLQRRIKTWRGETAHKLVFGHDDAAKADPPDKEQAAPASSEAP